MTSTEWPRPSLLRLYWLATIGVGLVWSGLCAWMGGTLARQIDRAEIKQIQARAGSAALERDELLDVAAQCLGDGDEMLQYIEKPTTVEAALAGGVHGAVGEGDDADLPAGQTCVPATEVLAVPVYEGTTF